jgi:hypothetical protein
MEKRCVDVLKVILDKGELRNSQIVAEIKEPKNNYSWGLDADDTLKVTVSNILKQLRKDYLKRISRGHMNVRYRFKSKSAKEKARLLVFSQSSEELKEAMRDIIEVNPDDIEILLMLPAVVITALDLQFSRTGRTERIENLRFYKNRGLEIIGILYEIFFDLYRGSSSENVFKLANEMNSTLFDGFISEDRERLDLLEKVMSMEGLVDIMKNKGELLRAHRVAKTSTAL